MIDVSIIYVNFNTQQLTLESIASVYKFTQTLNFEIILVDNASDDNSISEIKLRFPDVKIIQNKNNVGFGRANNQGVKIAKGKYCLLLNTDTYLINSAIKILYNVMEEPENQNVAVCGARLFKPDNSYCISSGLFPNYNLFIKGSFWKIFYPKSFYNIKGNRSIPVYEEPYEVDYVSGADFFVRTEVFENVGGFNEKFFLYSEETELSYRIRTKFPHFIFKIVSQAKIVHIGQGSSKVNNNSKKFKLRQIKSQAIYFRITKGLLPGAIYYLTSIKRLYWN